MTEEEIKEYWRTAYFNEKHKKEELEKEIAELKDQLTKAKKLLNMFLRLHYNPIVDEHTLFCKVEQFLKDSEVEK